MGVWRTGVSSSDEFCEVCEEFYERYFEDTDPIKIASDIRNEYAKEFFDDDGQIMNPVLFALAKCLWECGAKDQALFDEVGEIIAQGKDLPFWEAENGGDKTLVKKRKAALDKFWNRLNSERQTYRKPKRKLKSKPAKTPELPSLFKGDVFAYRDESVYRAAVVLDHIDTPSLFAGGATLIAVCDESFEYKPTIAEILESKTSTIFWCIKQSDIPKKGRFVVGKLEIPGNYNGRAGFLISRSTVYILSDADRSFFFRSEKCLQTMRRLLIGTYSIKAVIAVPGIIPGIGMP